MKFRIVKCGCGKQMYDIRNKWVCTACGNELTRKKNS